MIFLILLKRLILSCFHFTSWPCVNKRTAKKKAMQGEQLRISKGTGIIWHFQSEGESLPIPLSSSFWPLLTPSLCDNLSLFSIESFSPLTNHTQFSSNLKKVLPSITFLCCFSQNTCFLLLSQHLFCVEPLRGLYLPQIEQHCIVRGSQWPSDQQTKELASQSPFYLSSWNVRKW